MTAFSEADLDQLADFVGGALDGTPEADHVRHLVSTEESWAEAYAMLVTADAATRDELHALGAEPAVVPPDVAQRLDAALAGAIVTPPTDGPVVDLARAREARRRRRMRWTAGLAAAAAVLVCGGVGVQVLRDTATNSDKPSAAMPDAGRAEQQTDNAGGVVPAEGSAGSGSAVTFSGRDYAPGTVGNLSGQAPQAQSESRNNLSGSAGAAASVPSPLARLADPAARAACLSAITKEYGGQVALVDYAAFQGQPALVVVVDGSRTAAGKRLVVVVGPDCGIGGAIADERYRTTTP
ncbi:hypothetical protein Dvina_53810 [Dactylosporangium vinaceum]|uniref:Uncharacterized protein n=1 Tax=Dactylosporangium vinaceum TaxID=53362 RepID=A0ABV5MQP4_9ACTN|nr:hypothetical protein [Dactylosporangium vinaceum]UAB96667.1 hypothetical protein Dvina_53810 [Dactylosporangium vinaceum]